MRKDIWIKEEMENTILTIQKKGFRRRKITFKTPLKKADFSKDIGLFVILTVPHSKCINEKGHNCDITALKNAENLSRRLNKEEIENKILIGDINRYTSDLNRKESRNTEFHKVLDGLIENIKDKCNIILLDIHSGDFGKYSFVILKSKSFFELELLNIIQNETNAVVFVGAEANYIIEKVQKQRIPALLLEFNELRIYEKSFHNKIVRAISLWYKKYFIE